MALWEPEPLRWIGSTLIYRAMVHFDRVEERTGRPSRAAPLAERVLGR